MKLTVLTFLFVLMSCSQLFCQEKQSVEFGKDDPRSLEKGLTKVSVMYPFSEGKTFNMDYYESKHMPMVAGYLGKNLVKYTIEKGIASGNPSQPLPFVAIGTFYVRSLQEYQTSISPNRDAIRADFKNYTDIVPVILVSEVVR